MTPNAFVVCCGLLAFLWEPVIAECPDHHHIDVKWNKTHYMGAYRYDSQSSPNALQSCMGTVMKRYEGYEATAARGTQFVEHAWVVRPGCVAYEFSEYNFKGTVTEFPAGVHPQVPRGSKSYKVRCSIAHFQCTPIDQFETVLTCDATAAVAASECNYMKTVGTKFIDSVSRSMSLGASVQAEVTASFFSIFSAALRTSLSTGYNWSSVSEITKESMESFEVKASAPPGYILKIEQAIGRCGGSQVKTELFTISHYVKTVDSELKLLKKVYKNTTEIGYGILSDVRKLVDLASNSTRPPGSFHSADYPFGKLIILKDYFVVYTYEITKEKKSCTAFFMTDNRSQLTFEVSGLNLFPCDEEYLHINDGATIESTLCDGKASVESRGSRFLFLQYGRQTNTGTAFNITVKAVPDVDAKTEITEKNSLVEQSFTDSQLCSACGNQTGSTRRARVLEGYTARVTENPWMVGVHITRERTDPKSGEPTTSLCGASILDRRHVLTAAHCVTTKSTSKFPRITDFYVVAGSNLGFDAQKSDVDAQKVNVEDWYSHPSYKPDSEEGKSYDIAVLRLAQDLQFNSRVAPVCLAPPMNFLGSDVTVTGYGFVLREGMSARQLQGVKLSIRSNDECDAIFKLENANSVFRPHQVCLYSPSKDACQGDSGGPAVLKWENRSYQVGVVSFGFNCKDKNIKVRYGGYARVSSFIPWIRSVLKGNSTC